MSGWLVLHPVSQSQLGMGVGGIGTDNGKETAVLVPSQDMVNEVVRRLERGGGDRHAVTVQTFDRFVRLTASNRPRPLMTPVEQEWLVRQAVSQVSAEGKLRHHRHMTNKSGWLSKVEARIGEWKRAGVRPGRLTKLWDKQHPHLTELGFIYSAYQELLDAERLWDHEEPYFEGMERMRRGEAPLPARVIVEHVPDLSVLQEQWLIQAVTQGVDVFLHLSWDPSRPRLFQETARTVERFQLRGFRVRGGDNRFPPSTKGALLAHLEEQLFRNPPAKREGNESVQVVAAAGVEEEVDRVVARVKQWLDQSGRSLSDVAILTQQPERYHPLLFPRLERAGLPAHHPHRIPLASHPMAETVRLALRFINGQRACWRMLLDSAYLPGLPARHERLEWQRRAPDGNIPLHNDPIGDGEKDEEKGEVEMESFRGLVDWLRSAPSDETWEGWVNWFGEWIRPLRPLARPAALTREEWHMAAVDRRAWEGLEEIRSGWERIFSRGEWGELPCDASSFLAALEGALEKRWLTVRPGRKGGVRILEPNQVRGRRFAAVFLLGCAEGRWPRPVTQDWLVSDDERRRLQKEGVMVATSEEQRVRQWLPFFQSVQAAEERLVCSFPAVDESGNTLLPSPFLDEMTQAIPSLQETMEPAPLSWQDCATGEQGLELALSLQDSLDDTTSPSLPDWKRWRQALPWEQDETRINSWAARVDVEKDRWGSQYTPFDGVLKSSIHTEWVKEEIQDTVWSATSLNEAVRCPFHFFAGRMLRVRPAEMERLEPTPLERGEILHRILCRFWDRYRKDPDKLQEGDGPWEHLDKVAETVWREEAQRRGWDDLPPWYQLEARRLQPRLMAMVKHERWWREKKGASSSFRPRWLEWGFGLMRDEAAIHRGEADLDSRVSPVELDLGEAGSIRVRGKVDRVDMDDEGRYILYDYKSGTAPSARDVIDGYHLQLPLYLWVLQQEMGLDPDRAVGAAFYTSGNRKGEDPPSDNRNQGMWRADGGELAGISSRVGGWLERDAWEGVFAKIRKKIARRLQELEQGRFAVAPVRECPATCPHRTICRIDRQRLLRKERGKSQ
ncbi:PD-(D/E)XK nuclease family protein [Desmospora profundinema]|uniref:ATP-dependent helicase/DNAse subunit B n=1 Tax=Desmospora profundinema TaxID=1571184 RepID=A0ABU1IKB4_9BACL|nr:PD-(D/E)XK nuclease family protein [Desmospora profundinema]MDR6225230.1 ATP-dependent helicase/DNAse subunit B [Desmospora profundinema]